MKVAVIVLNFKVKELTLKCVESVQRSSLKDLEVIVVDNSKDDELKSTLSKDIEYIPNENTGYSGGNNLGIKKALKENCQYILILNPDAEIEKNTIEILLKTAEKEDAGIVCPKIYFGDRETIWYAGGIFDRLNVIGTHRGVDEKDNGQYDELIETDFAAGACMLVKSEVFEKVGLLDEKYFLYYEDADFSERVKKSGYKILYEPKAKVFHDNAKSTGLGSPLQDYYITRNRMLFASKYLPFRTRFALFREALRNIGNPRRRLALWDFITGNLGKGSFH